MEKAGEKLVLSAVHELFIYHRDVFQVIVS